MLQADSESEIAEELDKEALLYPGLSTAEQVTPNIRRSLRGQKQRNVLVTHQHHTVGKSLSQDHWSTQNSNRCLPFLPTIFQRMATPELSELRPPNHATVTYDTRSESVTLPGGLVSVAGITVVTGGTELSCGSCTLAIGIWGSLIGVSVVAVGLWDHMQQQRASASLLLTLGLVILFLSVAMVATVVGYRLWRCCSIQGEERDEGKVVLVGERGRSVIKTVTV